MNRRSFREQVFKILFRAEFNSPEDMPQQAEMYFESGDVSPSPSDRQAITDKCLKIVDKLPEIDALLTENLKGWKLSRVGKVELAVLRLAVYEICWDDTIPTGVAINEAVELAGKYGQEDAGAFVNGVLGTIARNREHG